MSADGAVGIVAQRDIEAEAQLLSVPMDFVLWERTIVNRIRDVSKTNVKAALRSLKNDDDLLTLFLMCVPVDRNG